jgi:GMP synthase (glutamine-hydrolysing)
MILVIQICKETFHYYEFVKPIEDIIKKTNSDFVSIYYKNLTNDLISKSEKIIICGTSLKDNSFLDDFEDFLWLRDFNKPVFGICGGMHLLGLIFNGRLQKMQEIGLTNIKFKEDFFGLKDSEEVYELHNYYALSDEFYVFAESEKCPQAIKHKQKPFYAVLFHPEVRNKDLIRAFLIQ